MGQLVLIRHGESQYNLENRFTGWADPPLTERGRLEMAAAGDHIRGIALDLAFSSALHRAVESTRILLATAQRPDVRVEIAAELNERSYGELQGLNKDDAIARFGEEQVRLWRRSTDASPPGGESMVQASARVLAFLHRRVLPEAAHRNVVVCAHGNTLRAIVQEFEGLTEEAFRSLEIPTGATLMYKIDEDGHAKTVAKRMPPDTSPGGSIL